ncbi:MAG TPA: ATP phosphoribosyltransferase regulatory subunit, partial [Thermoflexales bacterium]|nr:ATP phosphoribosyltransferase regulatory subunit [Thermoflexales bacterium]
KEEYGAANETYARGADELREVVDAMRSLGMPEDAFAVDLTVVRGLEYYTGTVYETRLLAHPDLGSICSGGRYDDLASYFTTEKFPGVGISIGLSRLVFRLIEVGVLKAGPSTPAKVLVTVMDPARMQDYLKIGAELREAGISTEVFLEKGRIGDQLKYASRKGFACAVIAGGDEFLAGVVKVKNLNAATEQAIPREKLIEAVKAV